jgi:hypothetical protein
MFIRKLAVLASLATIGLLSLGAGAASAAHTTIRTDPDGAKLTGATTITNLASDQSTLTLQNLGAIHCQQTTFEATLHANTGTTSVTGTLNQLTFTNCTDSLPVIAITSCALDPTSSVPTIHIVADNSVDPLAQGTVQVTDPRVRCSIAGSTTSFCYYTGTTSSAIGNAFNSNSRIVFPNVTAHHVTGSGDLSGACGTQGAFNATLTDVVQVGTNKTITVTTS